jgi:hypothetical protein
MIRRRELIATSLILLTVPGTRAAGGNVVRLRGDVLVNGGRLYPDGWIQTGDTVETGPASAVVFTIGDTALWMRPLTRMTVHRGYSINAVSGLRMVTGAVLAVFGKLPGGRGVSRHLTTPTITVGVRGTGIYMEHERNDNTYFCNCYGEVDVSLNNAPGVRERLEAQYHASRTFFTEPRRGMISELTPPKNHEDQELEFLASLIGQQTAWQITGQRGPKDGRGQFYR